MSVQAPIVVFVFNRVKHARMTIESLRDNYLASESDLYIFSDGWRTFEDKEKTDRERKEVIEVREYLRTVNGFKTVTVTERPENWGLAGNVLASVTEVIKKHGSVIAVEDDLATSPNFLNFMNDALKTYQDNKDIWSVTGFLFPITIPAHYKHDVFLSYRASSLGWGTWIDRWEKADWEISDYESFLNSRKDQFLFNRGGNLTSALKGCMKESKYRVWAVRWSYNQFKNKAYTVFPIKSLVKNMGYDNTGTNDEAKHREMWERVTLDDGSWKYHLPKKLKVDKKVTQAFREHFTGPNDLKWYIKQYLIRFGIYKRMYNSIKHGKLKMFRWLLNS